MPLAQTSAVSDRYWALGAHPSNYRVLDSVLEREQEWWRTGGRPLVAGDLVAIYKYKGRDVVRGVIAFGRVLTDPEEMARPLDDAAYAWPGCETLLTERAPRVLVRYMRAPRLPLWLELNPQSVVSELSIARAQGGTAFHVTPEQWQRLIDEAGGLSEQEEADGAAREVEDLVRARPLAGGQGRRLTVDERRAVERRAVLLVTEHFAAKGWTVDDVSATSPYDLLCSRGDQMRRVEVKGTTRLPGQVLLTKNEVLAARSDPGNAVLAIAHGISLSADSAPSAEGGELLLVAPWEIEDAALEAITFRYQVPSL